MRILLCHNHYQQPGGEDQVFADEGALLESQGHEVLRYVRHNDDIREQGKWETAKQTFWNRRTYDELSALLQSARPAVMHCTNTFALISPAAYDAARAAQVPVVQSLHNFRLLCPNALFLRDGAACEDCLGKILAWPGIVNGCYRESRLQSAMLASMVAFHKLRGTWVNKVDRFIALAHFAKEKFIKGGIPADKIAVKSNFVPGHPQIGSGQGDYAIFVGRLSEEKGIATLLAAWKELPGNLRLLIVGDGPLAAQVKQATLQDRRISWLGRRTSAEVLKLIGAAQCLLLPSICYENCPKTLLEAFSVGTPVVASRLGAMAEFIDHDRTGLLFTPSHAGELAQAVQRIQVDERLRGKLRQAARAEYEHKYTPAANYQQLMEIYRQAGASVEEQPLRSKTAVSLPELATAPAAFAPVLSQ